jgi:hypothetical protein
MLIETDWTVVEEARRNGWWELMPGVEKAIVLEMRVKRVA